MQTIKNRHAVDILFTLALFCVLAASSLLVVMIGVQSYRGIAARMTDNFNMRTSLTYITTKVRQNDQAGAVKVEPFGDGNALVLEQSANNGIYRTIIYQAEGELRELFVNADSDYTPEDGQVIMEVSSLGIEQTDQGVIRLSIADREDVRVSTLLHPRCATLAGPQS